MNKEELQGKMNKLIKLIKHKILWFRLIRAERKVRRTYRELEYMERDAQKLWEAYCKEVNG